MKECQKRAFLEVPQAQGSIVGGGDQPEGPPDSPEVVLPRIFRTLQSIYGTMNGRGVRQGTLHPPTQTQRDRVDQAREELAALRARMP